MQIRRNRRATALLLGASLVWACATPGWAEDKKAASGDVITDGKQVSLSFALSVDGKPQEIPSDAAKEMVFVQGEHKIFPKIEKEVNGLKVGDKKHVELSPEEGFGEIKPEMKETREVPKESIEESSRKVGTTLAGRGPNPWPSRAEITEVKEKTVVLSIDHNHPFAGKKLAFDLTVTKVEDAPAKTETPAAAPAESPKPAPASKAKPEKK